MTIKVDQATEHQIMQVIQNYLKYKGWFVMRLNSGAIRTDKGNMVRMARAGTPDLIAFKAIVLARPDSLYKSQSLVNLLFVEVKRPKKKPTFPQEQMMEELQEYGARCIVATSIEDLQKQGI